MAVTISLAGSVSLALAAMGCQGQQARDPGTVAQSFELGTATSWFDDPVVLTEIRDGDDVVVATAEWQVATREGRIETGQQSLAAKLAPDDPFTLEWANRITYEFWADQIAPEPADLIPYIECERCTSNCCSCEGGSYCCVTEWCYDRELGTFNPRIDCGGTCGGGGGGSGGGECAFGGCNAGSCPWNCE